MRCTVAKKIVFYVPVNEAQKVKKALFDSGAGVIGNYDQCSFEVIGRGQFRPLSGADPFIGNINEVEYVDELRVEMICKDDVLKKALKALIEAHPYEEPAIDVIDLFDFSSFID